MWRAGWRKRRPGMASGPATGSPSSTATASRTSISCSGARFIGAVNVAVNWRLAPAEMAAIIDDSGAPLLAIHADYLPLLTDMTSGLPSVRRIVVIGDDAAVGADPRAVSFGAWIEGVPSEDPGYVGGPDDVSMQLYTSGTTGLPKGVMLTNANLSTAICEAGVTFHIADDTVSLVAMPLFHIGGSGWALCAMSRGGRSVILRDVDPEVLLELIATERITEMFVVPAVLMLLLACPSLGETDLSSLRLIFYGASPISEDVLVKCIKTFGCAFCQVYGMTETTGAITALVFEDHDPDGPRRGLLRSAGKPHTSVCAARRRSGQRAGRGAGRRRRGVDTFALQHGGVLAEARGDCGHHGWPTAGSRPETPGTSTRTGTCTCTIGSRT